MISLECGPTRGKIREKHILLPGKLLLNCHNQYGIHERCCSIFIETFCICYSSGRQRLEGGWYKLEVVYEEDITKTMSSKSMDIRETIYTMRPTRPIQTIYGIYVMRMIGNMMFFRHRGCGQGGLS